MTKTMQRIFLVTATMVVAVFVADMAQAAQTTKGEVTEVTVYRNQALVTRTIEVAGKSGPQEVAITDLPEKVIPASLSAESQGKSAIHSVTYRTKAISGETRPEVKKIDEEIAALGKQLRIVRENQHLLKAKSDIIGKLVQFTAATSELEIKSGVLNFQELSQLTEYCLGKREKFLETGLELRFRREEIEKQLELLQRERSELAAGYSQTQREALIYLTKESDRPVTITLSYLVSNVGWSPQYNLRSDDPRETVNIEYNALIRQMSGENWNDVKLTLSTAQPTFAAEPPVIEPLQITLGPKIVLKEKEVRQKYKQARKRRQAVQREQGQVQEDISSALNIAAAEEQVLELNVKKSDIARTATKAARVEGVSASYRLGQPVSLASRTDEQILRIANVDVPAKFRHIAAPVLTDFVYIEAFAKNTSPHVFLSGPANSYLDGEFVGRGKMELVAGGEEFKAGFGVDPQVQVDRELVKKIERIEGGNKVSEFTYKLTVSNYGTANITLRLEDRIPYSPKSSVQVKLIETEPELSRDQQYRTTAYKKGLLRWDLEIPAQATNDQAIEVTYRFTIAHDKEMAIKGMPKSQ